MSSIELFFDIWLYDVCFFSSASLMHRKQIGKMPRIHGYHHRSGAQTMNGFLQHINMFGPPSIVLSRLLHNYLNTGTAERTRRYLLSTRVFETRHALLSRVLRRCTLRQQIYS
jgi:hypothetical protein